MSVPKDPSRDRTKFSENGIKAGKQEWILSGNQDGRKE